MPRSRSLVVTALLGAALMVALLGHVAQAQQERSRVEPDATAGYNEFINLFLLKFAYPILGETPDEERDRDVWVRQDAASSFTAAVTALRAGNKRAFSIYRANLKDISESAPRRGTRQFARSLLKTLPDRHVSGFVFKNSDGTVVRDPDPFIRMSLLRAESLAAHGGDGAGAGDR